MLTTPRNCASYCVHPLQVGGVGVIVIYVTSYVSGILLASYSVASNPGAWVRGYSYYGAVPLSLNLL